MIDNDFEAFFSMSLDMMCIANFEGYFMTLNSSWEETLGFSQEELKAAPFVSFVHPDDQEHTNQASAGLAQGGVVIGFENRYRCKDGSYKWLHWTAQSDTERGLIYASARDITDLKEQQGVLQEAHDTALTLSELKSEFVSTVSHELRTPLTSIRGSLGLVAGGVMGELPPRALEMISIARDNTERLIRLINDILDLEKVESGKLELHLEDTNICEVIEKVTNGIEGMATERGVEIVVDCVADKSTAVQVDPDRFVQVLTNLLSNAIKFSDVGNQVIVRPVQNGSNVRIEVQDFGPGIPADKRELVFGKFQQVDSSSTRSQGGTGLGLAISRAIIEQHGGTIGFDSIEGEGTTFFVEIKRSLASDFRSTENRTPSAGYGSVDTLYPQIKQRDAVLIENDKDRATTLSQQIDNEGYRIHRASNIRAASMTFDSLQPHVVIIDLDSMPFGSDGINSLVNDSRLTGVPVIAVSSVKDEEGSDTQSIRKWVTVPFDGAGLGKVLNSLKQSQGQATALVVEDDDPGRRVIVEHLRMVGLHCMEAADGLTAVGMAMSNPPDVIVLDIGLPLLDGFGVVDALRRNGLEGIPLVVYTGRDLDSGERGQLAMGVTHYVQKASSTDEELADVVRSLLQNQPAGSPGELKAPAESSYASKEKSTSENLVAPLVSEGFQRLVEKYSAKLPNKIQEIEEAVKRAVDTRSPEDLQHLIDVSHRVRGSAGMYGFPEVSTAAGVLEDCGYALESDNADDSAWELLKTTANELVAKTNASQPS